MSTGLIIIGAVVAAAVIYLLFRAAGRTYLKYRGTRIVTCPETKETVAVEADAAAAAGASLLGRKSLHLQDCTRWPERQNCGQECLAQIERSPEGCLLRSILVNWYSGQSCRLCGKDLAAIHWHDHKPCLMDSLGVTYEWAEFKPETIPETLETSLPVCWDCHVSEKFRRQYPDLVIDRPENSSR